jgi:hypothetical protein
LTYSIDSDIIGSCSSELKEELNFQSENVLLSTQQPFEIKRALKKHAQNRFISN